MSVKIRKGSQWVNVASPAGAPVGTTRVAYLYDQKDSGTDGGSFTADAWRGRDLTTKSDPFSLILSFTPTTNGTTTPSPGNDPGVWTLAAGKYKIHWKACGLAVNKHKSRLTYATDSGFTTGVGYVYGSSSYGQLEEDTESLGVAILEPSATWYYKIEHYCKSTNSGGDGFGQASDITSIDEIYTQVVVEDLATAVKKIGDDYVAGTTKVATLQHQEAQNTDAGGFTAGAWQKRELTTESDPNNFVNFPVTGDTDPYSDWSLPAGSYKIRWSAPGYRVNTHQTRLIYATNSSFTSPTYVMGSSEESPTVADESQTSSFGETILTLTAAETWFRVEHRCQTSEAINGQGHACNFATEVYTQVSIEDLATAVKQPSFDVWNVVKTDTQVISNTSWNDISDLSQSVTAVSASSKFLITATVNCGMSADTHDGLLRLMRGTISIGSTNSSGTATAYDDCGFGQVGGQTGYYNAEPLSITYLDTPGVGTHTYHIEGRNNDSAVNLLINHRGAGGFYTTSQMTIQQIS